MPLVCESELSFIKFSQPLALRANKVKCEYGLVVRLCLSYIDFSATYISQPKIGLRLLARQLL